MLIKIRDNLAETEYKERRESLNFYALILLLVFLTVLVIHVNLFVIMNIEVSGSSMETTLSNGDNLIAIRGAKIERGDIIIINKTTHKTSEESDYYIIKRAIGIGGDVVEIKEDGKVYLNGEMLEEDYLDDFQFTGQYNAATFQSDKPMCLKVVLAEDEIFYLGDNRLKSLDARVNGACKKSDVISVVTDFSVKNKEKLTSVFKFMRSVSDDISGGFGCGSRA